MTYVSTRQEFIGTLNSAPLSIGTDIRRDVVDKQYLLQNIAKHLVVSSRRGFGHVQLSRRERHDPSPNPVTSIAVDRMSGSDWNDGVHVHIYFYPSMYYI